MHPGVYLYIEVSPGVYLYIEVSPGVYSAPVTLTHLTINSSSTSNTIPVYTALHYQVSSSKLHCLLHPPRVLSIFLIHPYLISPI